MDILSKLKSTTHSKTCMWQHLGIICYLQMKWKCFACVNVQQTLTFIESIEKEN